MTEPRCCPICEIPLVRRADEKTSMFLRRRTCGSLCGNILGQRNAVIAINSAKQPLIIPARDCPICGDPIVKRHYETPQHFRDRKTCGSRKCARQMGSLTSKPRAPSKKAVAALAAPLCGWCKERRVTAHSDGTYHGTCSTKCGMAYANYGYGPSKADIERRRAHLADQPKGCRSIEEFLEAGGTIFTEAPRWDKASSVGRTDTSLAQAHFGRPAR